jgi:hypothetical protein
MPQQCPCTLIHTEDQPAARLLMAVQRGLCLLQRVGRFVERLDAIDQMRAKQGRALSRARVDRAERLVEKLCEACDSLMHLSKGGLDKAPPICNDMQQHS